MRSAIDVIRYRIRRSVLLAFIAIATAAIGWISVSGVFADVSLSGGGQNCDNNAVVYCGATSASQLVNDYNSGDGHNSAASIQNIYSWFGITSAAVQSMPTTAVAGSVTSSGQVYVGSQLVASNALTAGRENIAGSTPETVGGTTFYTRSPSTSFASGSLSAYVVMTNGQFSFAVLSSCGNPIKATPVAPPASPPNLSLVKSTNPNFPAANSTVAPGAIISYKLSFANSGGAAQNVTITDPLPANTMSNYVGIGASTTQGFTAATNQAQWVWSSIPAGGAGFTTWNIQVNSNAPNGSQICNTATITAVGLSPVSSNQICMTVQVPSTPSGVCTGLTLSQAATNPRLVTATAADTVQNGATLKSVSFDWGDKTALSSNGQSLTAQHLYDQDGAYTVIATLAFSGPQAVPSVTCSAPITAKTAAPVCGELDIQTSNTTVTVSNFTYSSNDGPAVFSFATIDWGDGSPVTQANSLAGQTHTYANGSSGTDTIIATAHFTVNGQPVAVTSSACQRAVTFTPPAPTPPPPATPTVTTTAAQTQLVNTGAGNVVGLFIAASIAGIFVYRQLLRHYLKR